MAEKGAQAALGVQGDREHKESQGEAGVPAGGGGGGTTVQVNANRQTHGLHQGGVPGVRALRLGAGGCRRSQNK